jgi:adenylate kinase
MALRLILLGPPASGKGTQGRAIAGREGLDYLSTGALLRAELEKGGPLAEAIRPVLARGGYVDDPTMCRIMGGWLSEHGEGWVLDGFPRTVAQDDFLVEKGLQVDAAVSLEVPKEELIRRIEDRVECGDCRWSGQRSDLMAGRCPQCGGQAEAREDDALDNFLKRHEEFSRHTLPVIRRYEERGKLIRCDATDEIADVKARLEKEIDRLKHHGQTT